MAIDTREVRRALKSSGVGGISLLFIRWPFTQGRKLRETLRRRLAVIEARNAICDLLFPLQRPLTDYQVDTLPRVRELLADPARRKLLLRAAQTRTVIAEELLRSAGLEVGATLDLALEELIAARVVLRVPARDVLAHEDAFLLMPHHHCPRLDTAELKRLVRERGTQAEQLQRRQRRRATTDGSRSYDL